MDPCLQSLRSELRVCQQRLGTASELSSDFETAMVLAHQINNHVAGEYLRAAVTQEGEPPSFVEFCRTRLRV